ncbi:MAG: ribonuclease HII [Clostridia bacterium]|nr:ribonuclease HII [Clostridia bacterium]
MNWFEYEHNAIANGFNVVCGVDEAGRGPLAGPVFAAAVILPIDKTIDGLDDSKKLTEKKRDILFDKIIEEAVDYCIASVDEKTIDDINILQATFLAMRNAVNGLKVKPDIALIDGNQSPHLSIAEKTIIKGDSLSASIAAASILAKVSRDRFLLELDKEYPQYCFAKHKGYGTKLHYEMLDKYGVSPVHRLSFLKKYLGK